MSYYNDDNEFKKKLKMVLATSFLAASMYALSTDKVPEHNQPQYTPIADFSMSAGY